MAYTPYKMAAVGSSPIIKNFGTKEERGHTDGSPNTMRTFGIDSTEDEGGVGSGLNSGSSPAKGWFSNIAKKVGGAVKGIGKKVGGVVGGALGLQSAGDPAEAAVAGASETAVPPHGDEAHSGGAIGGAPEAEPAFQAMDRKGFMGMGGAERKEYMGGLDKSQRKEQMSAMMPKPFGGGGGVGGGMFGNMFSDIRLKEKIQRMGESPSGIPIYEFNYIGCSNRYSGAMAQDLLNTEHVSIHESGFYMVDYNNIDIDMKLV